MLTTSEFADAVRTGMGRAVLAVDGPVSKEFEDIILAACLEDQRHDRQCESNRSGYLMDLVDRASLAEKLLPILLEPIDDLMSDWDQLHRARMLGQFANRSSTEALTILRNLAVRQNSYAWEVLADHGDIEWLVRHILPSMPLDEKWRVASWREECASLSDEFVVALSTAEEEFEALRNKSISENKIRNLPTFDEALALIQEGTGYVPDVMRLGPVLSEEQLFQAAKLWVKERDRRKANNYRRLIERRDFPLPVKEVVDAVMVGDPPIQFEKILSLCQDPLCRELGTFLINQPEPDYRGYMCLGRFFLDDDLPWMVESLGRFSNQSEDTKHRLGMDLKEIATDMTPAESEPFLVWVYEHTPCSMCRGFAAEMMIGTGTLPDLYREEMKYDADAFARELAAKMS